MSTARPNIILIMTDQQRADTIAAHGYGHMYTPTLDRLARESVSFMQAFSCGATCVVSRAAAFTGMYAHNTGAYNFDNWAHHRSWVQDLGDAGYHCVNIGKMHISPLRERMGFHERVVVENQTNKESAQGREDDEWGKYLSLHGVKRPNDRHKTDPDWRSRYQAVPWAQGEHLHHDVFIANAALGWMNRHVPNKPVFLQIGFTGPHEPYSPLKRHLDRYEHADIPLPQIRDREFDEKPPQIRAHQQMHAGIDHESCISMDKAGIEDLVNMRKHYYASISTIDEQIGRILERLREQGYLDNAIVLFTSDHGDMLGDHRLPYKWLMYDSAVKVPLMLWRSAMADDAPGSRVEAMASLIDLGPTVLEAAGVAVPPYLEGRSLLGYADGHPPVPVHYAYCEDNYLTMVRGERYKLVHYTGQEENGELYDLQNDPHELLNLFHREEYRPIRQELQYELMRWITTSTYRTTGYKNGSFKGPRFMPKPPYFIHH